METGAPIYDHHHAVQFYRDDESLATTVAAFLSQGFVDRHPAIIIATEEHRDLILASLREHFIDINKAQQFGSLVVLDAQETLDQLMDRGQPDPERFDATIGRLIRRMLEGRRDRILIRAYGEMVDLLWKQGRPEAAISLEGLWNRLAQRYGFALFCGYSMSHFDVETAGFEEICREHTHVIAPLAEPIAVRRHAGSCPDAD